MKIRTRIMLLVIPLFVAGIVTTAVFSSSAGATGIGTMTVRLLRFKTNELAKQMYGQWDLLVRNGFAGESAYVEASKLTVTSYAQSIVQSGSELVFALDGNDSVQISTRPAPFTSEELAHLRLQRDSGVNGWIEFELGSTPMVGEARTFEPFDWFVVVSDERAAVFSQIRTAIWTSAIVLVIALGVGVALLYRIAHHLSRPVKELIGHVEDVTRTGEFSRPISVERSDELGFLARRFNYMASTLVTAKKKLADFATVATVAKIRAADGERETLEVLGRAAEYRDNETASHVKRVGRYAQMLGELHGLEETQAEVLMYAAPLHDVGKIGVPDSILFKPARLTDAEFDVIKTHPLIGYEILRDSRSEFLRAGSTIAMYHHEWYDGNGYPTGADGSNIPLFARIVAIVDTFDAVTSERPYKEAWSLEKAFEVLEEEAGTHLDPALVRLFVGNVDMVREIMTWQPDET